MDSFWDFFWFIISFFLLMAYLMVMFQILTDLFRDQTTNGWAKAVWVFCLILFPIITALVYIFSRGDAMAQRQLSSTRAAQESTDAYIRSVSAGGASPSDEIARAKTLLDDGSISQGEFDRLKEKALS